MWCDATLRFLGGLVYVSGSGLADASQEGFDVGDGQPGYPKAPGKIAESAAEIPSATYVPC